MSFLKRNSKRAFGEPEESSVNVFLIAVVLAALALTCFLIYALVSDTLSGEREPKYEIVPYGGGTPLQTPVATLMPGRSPTPVASGPTPTPSPTPPSQELITPGTALRVGVVSKLFGHSNPVSSVAFSPDGRFIASGDWDGLVKLWNAASQVEVYTFRSASNRVSSVAFSPDSRQLAAAGQDAVARRWDLNTAAEIAPLTGAGGTLNSLAYHPAGTLLAAASDDGKVYLWNLPDGEMLGALSGHTSYVTSVAFSPDGEMVAAGGEDDTVRLWSIPEGQPIATLRGHTSTISSVAFSPDGATLASTGADHSVRLWNVLSASQVATLSGHLENVNSVAFSPDGLLVASAAGGIEDNTVRLWDARTGTQLRVLYPDGPVNSVAFSPNGLTLATGGATFLTLWGVTDTVQPAFLTPTPSVFPSPALQSGEDGEACVLTARAADATMRAGPGAEHAVVGSLALNQQVQATGWARDADGFTWWQLTNGAWARGDGFLDADNQTLPDACWTLPVVEELPSTPAVTAVPPTLAPGATPAVSCLLTARVDDANVRSGPGTTYDIMSKLALNQQVQATGWTTGDEGYTWWRLASDGWARGDVFIDAANPNVPDACLGLPLVNP